MFGFIFKKIFGSKNDRYLRRLRPIVARINALEPQMQELADEVLARYPDTELPETAQGVRSYFAKVWPALKYAGIEHTTSRGAKQRTHTLSRAR